MKDDNELNIPFESLSFIHPDDRKMVFVNMLENYKVYFPDLKLVYGALNYDSSKMFDYLLIFETERSGIPMIVWSLVIMYTTPSTPGYKYAIINNKYKEFFYICTKSFCQMMRSKFYEYLKTVEPKLSTSPNNEKYWKNPDNSAELMDKMYEIGVRYKPPGFRTYPPPAIIKPRKDKK